MAIALQQLSKGITSNNQQKRWRAIPPSALLKKGRINEIKTVGGYFRGPSSIWPDSTNLITL